MQVDDQYQKAINLKEEGNQFFRAKDLTKALRKYYEALLSTNSFLSSSNVGNFLPPQIADNYQNKANEENQDFLKEKYSELKLTVISNMCAIYIKQKKWDRVLKYGYEVLKSIDPGHMKIRYRVATAQLKLKNYEMCEEIMKGLTQDYPEDENILNLAETLRKAKDKSDKALFSKMSGMFG